jgi:pimeloyl-ACP methyl ester carboxylesterase
VWDARRMDVVLVHGTTQAPTGWLALSAALSERGHRAHLVDLPTDRPDLLAEDYATIAAVQCSDAESPVVVAHSAGGLLLPAIGNRLGATRLVWISATIPDPTGRLSFAEEVRARGAEMFSSEWLALREPPTADPVVSAYFLFHDCDLQTLRGALSTVRLFYPAAVYEERPVSTRSLPPSTFILPRAGRSLQPEWMRKTARERLGVEPVEVDAGHCPHVSRPDRVAQIIDS